MKIGDQPDPSTAISASNADQIVVRGYDLCDDLIGSLTLTEHFWLLLTGRRPDKVAVRMLDATLVAIAEHGLVPSVQASRMTLAAAPEAFQGAVAAGVLGCGSVILGSAELAGRFLTRVVAEADQDDLPAAARRGVLDLRAQKRAIPGFGHPLHKGGDPRTRRLLALAEELGVAGRHVAAARAIEATLPDAIGKALILNISGAIPAVLLDTGFPVEALKGVPILARTASLVAHLVEEQRRPIGFVLSEHAAKAIDYSGNAPADFAPDN